MSGTNRVLWSEGLFLRTQHFQQQDRHAEALMRAALLPIFGMDEISVVTGLQSLWQSDIPLALAVTFLAVFAPYAKTIGLALIHWNLLSPRTTTLDDLRRFAGARCGGL